MKQILIQIRNKVRQYLFYVDDRQEFDEVGFESSIKGNTQFSTSYILLLVSSAVIATLGLLQNSAPVIIGGMIISPLMWPLLKISYAITYNRKVYIKQAVVLLVVSFCITLLTSVIITYISPLKVVTNEIISRTNPILPDILIALFGGLVASFGLARTRISSSLAGVAIATSLMPPLCVVGIGLVLGNSTIYLGSLLLFVTNCVTIIFISTLVFTLVHFREPHSNSTLQRNGIVFITTCLILLSIPLWYFMQSYVYEISIQERVDKVITQKIQQIDPSVDVANVRATFSEIDPTFVDVSAEIITSNPVQVTFIQELEIKEAILDVLDDKERVNLRFTNQNIVPIQTAEEIENTQKISQIQKIVSDTITSFNSSFIVQDIKISSQNEGYLADTTVFINPESTLTYSQLDSLSSLISKQAEDDVTLSVTMLPLITVSNDPEPLDEEEKNIQGTKRLIENYFTSISSQIQIVGIEISDRDSITISESIDLDPEINTKRIDENFESDKEKQVAIEIKSPSSLAFDSNIIEDLKTIIRASLEVENVSIRLENRAIDILEG